MLVSGYQMFFFLASLVCLRADDLLGKNHEDKLNILKCC